jgi:hypothetical protein
MKLIIIILKYNKKIVLFREMLLILITNTKYSNGSARLLYLMQSDLPETIYMNIFIILYSPHFMEKSVEKHLF